MKPSPGPKTFSAPLGHIQRGQLLFPNGIARKVHVQADSSLEGLFQARFEYPVPEVSVREGEVSLHYHYIPIITGLLRQERPAEVVLNSRIPWRIEAQRGAADLWVDLSGIRLEGLTLAKGVGMLRAKLPVPSGSVPVRLAGGVADVRLHIPAGVAVRVLVKGGAANLNFDQQHFGAVSGSTRWETPHFQGLADRYDIEILGGAANLTLERYAGGAA